MFAVERHIINRHPARLFRIFMGIAVKSSALRSPDLAADEILASVVVSSLSGLKISGGHVSADNYYPFLDFGV